MPTPIPSTTAALPPAAQPHLARQSRTTLPDLALPARRCRATAPAGVLGSGVLAGLDVLPGCYGNAGRTHRPGRHCGSGSPYTTAHGHGAWCRADIRRAGGAGWAGLGGWVVFALVALALVAGG